MTDFFAILSPTGKGMVKNYPSILLDRNSLVDGDKFLFRNGEIQRMNGRLLELSQILPDIPVGSFYFKKESTGLNYSIYGTKRDLLYRDSTNNRFNFITPQFSTGTIAVTQGDATVAFSGTDIVAAGIKAGDFITIGTTYSTADKWYEVLSITDTTHLELTINYAEANGTGVSYLIRKTFAGTNTDYWRFVKFHDKLIATNNGIDWIQTWYASAATNQTANLNTTFKCKYLAVYENHLLCGYTIESGTPYPKILRGSDLNDETDFTAAADSDAINTTIDGQEKISALRVFYGNLLVFTEGTIQKYWYTGGEDIYNSTVVCESVGTKAPDSLITTDKGIYFYASDNYFRLFNLSSWEVVSSETESIVKNLHPSYIPQIQGIRCQDYNQLLWAVPDATSTGRLNRLLTYDQNALPYNAWGQASMEISCFGQYYSETTYTIDTIPFSSIDEITWSKIDSQFGLANAPILVCGGYDKYIYRMFSAETDVGAAYNGYFTLDTDLADRQLLNIYKRLNKMVLIMRGQSTGTLSIYVKKDYNSSFELVSDTVSIVSNSEFIFVDVFCDLLARNYQIKIQGANAFSFIGIIFEFKNLRSTR